MTTQIARNHQADYIKLKEQIQETVRSNEIYEKEESTRKLLLEQVNVLKHCKFIVTINSEIRAQAGDGE